jgi:hypothetical protein
VRDSESVLSGYFSFATSAPHLFGDRVEDFATDVRELLRARSPQGLFWDWPGDTEVVLARKPRSARDHGTFRERSPRRGFSP